MPRDPPAAERLTPSGQKAPCLECARRKQLIVTRGRADREAAPSKQLRTRRFGQRYCARRVTLFFTPLPRVLRAACAGGSARNERCNAGRDGIRNARRPQRQSRRSASKPLRFMSSGSGSRKREKARSHTEIKLSDGDCNRNRKVNIESGVQLGNVSHSSGTGQDLRSRNVLRAEVFRVVHKSYAQSLGVISGSARQGGDGPVGSRGPSPGLVRHGDRTSRLPRASETRRRNEEV